MKSSTSTLALRQSSRFNVIVAVVVAIAVATAGYVLLVSRAFGPFAALEPETGTASSAISIGNDSNASGGKYLQFGAGTNTPPPPPTSGYLSDYYKKWSNGPNPTGDPSYFPIAVWLQWPGREFGGKPNGVNYQNIGIDTDIGVEGDKLASTISTNWKGWVWYDDINTIKAQSAANAKHFTAYVLEDEPDMNQWNDPVANSPAALNTRANQVRSSDPTRPTYLGLGKPIAIDGWPGYPSTLYNRNTGSHDGDMKSYCKSADIIAADYYGWTDPYNEIGAQNNYHGAWTYGKVIDNIRRYCDPGKPIMADVETYKTWDETPLRPTPDQIEQAVWNIVVHGGNGIIYFAHGLYGGLVEDGLLQDPAISSRIGAVNARVKSLAPVLNSPSQTGVTVSASNSIPVTFMHKHYNGSKYIVAQADGDFTRNNSGATTATFTISGVTTGTATVVDENRTVPIVNGKIVDDFKPYGFHVYKF